MHMTTFTINKNSLRLQFCLNTGIGSLTPNFFSIYTYVPSGCLSSSRGLVGGEEAVWSTVVCTVSAWPSVVGGGWMDSGSVAGGGVGDMGGGCGAGVSVFGSSISDSGLRTRTVVTYFNCVSFRSFPGGGTKSYMQYVRSATY